ncbi:MAG: bifunctional 2-C-methyl-D-erythritol 4-phosphate cytidylyltransferase/2-C-methyl-D-erythritol 2,4-cyclodiphosphate synthase [Alphaproteobacteria bacterium]|nr:bifunctional 2-C-methyl-D-erythritol 4-phosphate cytidylyltransferase/2-C-methyl-D-erythritol 2,4-cyclodiphosphate synthase [Alphaproteobacteria bacterium]
MTSPLPPFHVVIVAAGGGSRFDGGEVPKQYMALNGKPILRYSLEMFSGFETVLGVHVVIDPAHQDLFRAASRGIDVSSVVAGGASRSDSVQNAVEALDLDDGEIVLVHDAARPLVCRDDIAALLRSMDRYDAATLACPVVDTVRYGGHGADVSREDLWAVQTPQAFRFGVLKKAHAALIAGNGFTDDCGMVRSIGVDVGFVKGSRTNFKITYAEDLVLAQKILGASCLADVRTGSGFDVHAFDNEALGVKAVRLCGVDVPYERKLKGHSDADVGLHALTDALLGAIGGGDIGQLFPPSDPAFKDMDSRVFLEKARDLVREAGAVIGNVDVTIICEAPKVGPHREAMVLRVAEILDIERGRVNIKATTTERLGFTGREEGIAAQAVASVVFQAREV